MTVSSTSSRISHLSTPSPWVRALLGVVMIVAGVLVLGDVVVATLLSAIVIGALAIVAGGFEIVHAFWTKGWGGFVWQIVLGIIYVAFGLTLLSQPVSGVLLLTFVFGLLLLASGVLRVGLAFARSGGADWIMVWSGAFGMLAGLIILIGWPASGLWFLGTLLGIDLIFHGVAWLFAAWRPVGRTA
jgi:uncharacterized membrane protein HdeD (DUF308 family)